MDHSDIRERVRSLRMQLARLQAANEIYLSKRSHSLTDVVMHSGRQQRLHDILDELAEISRRIKAA
jgi:hypothetical protein